MGILEGKVVLITGAGRGIGRGHALVCAEQGARVVVNDLGGSARGEGASADAASEVAALIKERGGEAIADTEDISSWEGSRRAVHHAIEHFGRIDGVVNNAGIIRHSAVADVEEVDVDALFGVHFKGTLGTTTHACDHWRSEHRAGRRPKGSIVNTISDGMLLSLPPTAVYSAMKAACASLTLTGSIEGRAYGVRMNAMAPRAFTRMGASSNMTDNGGVELKEADEYIEPSPLNPSNCSPIVAWLLSDESLHVTGQVFRTLAGAVAQCHPWSASELIWPPDGAMQFDPADIGPILNAEIFHSRFPQRELDWAPGDPRRQAHQGRD